MDVVASQGDMSAEPKFAEAVAKKVYYGPVYFRRESEPYMTLSLAGTRRDAGVSVAEVNLKLIWDVVTGIKVGEQGQAFVIDAQGRLIAHPDISLVLRNTDMTRLTQVVAARAAGSGAATEPVQTAVDVRGRNVLTAYAPVAPLGWIIFVELPFEEAYAPLYDAIKRSSALLFAGLTLAFLSGVFLARRMVVPIQMLRAGAARIGAGDLTQRVPESDPRTELPAITTPITTTRTTSAIRRGPQDIFLAASARTISVPRMFVSIVRTGLSTINRTPTAAARWCCSRSPSRTPTTTAA
jgi:methyl-accepting chemotaxis protein